MPGFSYSSDLETLVAIFAINTPNLVVFDPGEQLKWDSPKSFKVFTEILALEEVINYQQDEHFLVVNLSPKQLDRLYMRSNVTAMIQFGAASRWESYQRFYYINNPSGTIRWIYADSVNRPSFLNLYNSAGWKANLYRKGAGLLFLLGKKEWLSSGSFLIRSKTNLLPNHLLRDLSYDQFTIFTGTTGISRKAIIEVQQNARSRWFLKIPIGKEAFQTLENEKKCLLSLKSYDFKYTYCPEAQGLGHGLLLENIKPDKFSPSITLEGIHLNALAEWYSLDIKNQSVTDSLVFQELEGNLNTLQSYSGPLTSPFSESRLQGILRQMNQLREKFSQNKTLPMAWAHGDFTPWNLYRSPSRLYVYDWEMARPRMPLLFDAFHFIFQSSILIKRTNWESIAQELEALRSQATYQEMARKYQIDFSDHLEFYLLYIMAYYLPRYLLQQPLHEQASWLLDTWEAALNRLEQDREVNKGIRVVESSPTLLVKPES